MAVPEKSLANLKPIRDSQTARDMNRRSQLARQAKRADEERKRQEAEDRSREHLARLAYEALFQALEDENVPVQARLTAARDALDRLEGKPTQKVETTHAEAGPLEELSQQELEARLASLREARLRLVEPAEDLAPKAQPGNP